MDAAALGGAALWHARPGAPALPVRLAAHVLGELASAAEAPAAPRSALLRLLLQGLAAPALPSLPPGFPAACAPREEGPPEPMAPPSAQDGCSLDTLVAWARAQLASALDASPVLGRLHNGSAVAEALWAPLWGSTLYPHEQRVAALSAAAAAGDLRGLADAYYPRARGRAVPTLATFFNVGLLADGSIVSVDEVLQRAASAGRGNSTALDACALASLSIPEPPAVAHCTNRSEAAYLMAVAARAPFSPPVAGGAAAGTDAECAVPGLSDAEAARVVAQHIARGAAVETLPYAGEVAADPRVASGAGAQEPPPPCTPGGGWRCSVSHALDAAAAPAERPAVTIRVSPVFRKS